MIIIIVIILFVVLPTIYFSFGSKKADTAFLAEDDTVFTIVNGIGYKNGTKVSDKTNLVSIAGNQKNTVYILKDNSIWLNNSVLGGSASYVTTFGQNIYVSGANYQLYVCTYNTPGHWKAENGAMVSASFQNNKGVCIGTDKNIYIYDNNYNWKAVGIKAKDVTFYKNSFAYINDTGVICDGKVLLTGSFKKITANHKYGIAIDVNNVIHYF